MRKRPHPPVFAALVAAVLATGSCGPSGPEGARLTVTVVGDAERPGSLARQLVAEATQPTLVARDGTGQAIAGLATSWRFVDDGRSLILRLRPQDWSDGKALVSRDVVAAFRRAGVRREPVLAQAGIAGAEAVLDKRLPATKLGVLAPISRVVELRLESTSPLLLGWLTAPELGVTSPDPEVTLAAYRASGVASRQLLKRLRKEASPEARPAEIVIDSNKDARAAVTAFARGETDIVMSEGLAGLGEARTVARGGTLQIDPLWGVYGYRANSRKGPTADPRVRLALAMAIDRERLATAMGVAGIAPAESLLPPSLGGAPSPEARRRPGLARAAGALRAATGRGAAGGAGGEPTEDDWGAMDGEARLVRARVLLAAAGFDAERPLRLVLLLPPGRDHRGVAELVAADWSRIGVQLVVTEVSAAIHQRLVTRGNYELAVTEASVPVPDAAALLAKWRCGPASGYCNPEADALLDAARRLPATGRPPLLADAEAAMMTAPPMIPLLTPIRWALVGRHVEGWTPNPAASHPVARLAVGSGRR